MRICLFLTLLTFCCAPGCSDSAPSSAPPTMTADQPDSATAKTTDTPVTAASERQAFDGLEFVVPTAWKQVQLSQFQMGIISAKFEMPDAGPDVTLTLSRSGGGTEANLNRWRGQVEASRAEVTETVTVAGVEATLIDMEGRFSGGFGKPTQDGWRMIGVIVPLSDQGYFLKLTGPADQVEAVEDDFRAFMKSAVTE